jgi:hypothetical protein
VKMVTYLNLKIQMQVTTRKVQSGLERALLGVSNKRVIFSFYMNIQVICGNLFVKIIQPATK